MRQRMLWWQGETSFAFLTEMGGNARTAPERFGMPAYAWPVGALLCWMGP